MAVFAVSCSDKSGNQQQGEQTMPQRQLAIVLQEHTDELMAMPGVVGTAEGLCEDKPCIKVYVAALTPELEQKIPKNIEGYAVEIEATGEFDALPVK